MLDLINNRASNQKHLNKKHILLYNHVTIPINLWSVFIHSLLAQHCSKYICNRDLKTLLRVQEWQLSGSGASTSPVPKPLSHHCVCVWSNRVCSVMGLKICRVESAGARCEHFLLGTHTMCLAKHTSMDTTGFMSYIMISISYVAQITHHSHKQFYSYWKIQVWGKLSLQVNVSVYDAFCYWLKLFITSQLDGNQWQHIDEHCVGPELTAV